MLMEHVSSNKRTAARILFISAGFFTILLFLLWNPLVLRPRSWSAAVVVRSLSIDALLLLIGVGLIRLRRWAALLASVLAVYVAVDLVTTRGGLGVVLALGLLMPLL